MQPGVRGMELLNRQTLNKGTAFTEEERTRLGCTGCCPHKIETLDEQVVRAYGAYKRKDEDLERHICCARCRTLTKCSATVCCWSTSKR